MESTTRFDRLAIKNRNMLQLYSAATPNGIKVAACLEELIHLKQNELYKMPFDYEPHTVDIRHAESRDAQYMSVFPNGKIPAIIDPNGPDGREVRVFESGAILMYLAEQYDALMPRDAVRRLEVTQWLFWGSTTVSPQFKLFGFYYKYCPHRIPYCVERYSKECHRLLAILEQQLAGHGKHYVIGDEYTIADISMWPWVYGLKENYGDAFVHIFGSLNGYPCVQAWFNRCMERPASKKSLEVCPFVVESS